ncbi:reverse transcriptase domain-containing protein [Alicyclobacillus dauci]|uniref:Reverse transcriptase/maturase family protein n=1 Tax=Alicyclobacillus dauci TaxID=1475485 RepID=A0ABY6Z7N0_9BACL|nr:reverse transcriptase domain-containing protein [Alicyclobacillus dauci]WAH38755.1 reverse transcriptase/maturase family protein [Alicyclobacillus dauci]
MGITVIQDRLVQMATKIILESVFQADFKDCSFGFRPKRSAKQVIQRTHKTVNFGRVYWVVDVDITGYFNNISHDKLLQLVEQRVSDPRVLKPKHIAESTTRDKKNCVSQTIPLKTES